MNIHCHCLISPPFSFFSKLRRAVNRGLELSMMVLESFKGQIVYKNFNFLVVFNHSTQTIANHEV